MASDTEIANMALSHLGVGKEIANIATEQSQEASACRRFFDTAREATLRDFNWPFAKKTAALGLLTDSEDDAHPTDEWNYAYRYPSECVAARRIESGTRNDTRGTRVPYKIVKDAEGKVIYTDKADAILEYTERLEDPSYYTSDFIMAFSFRLASYISPRLTGGDPFKLGQRAMQLYEYEISKAEATALNEQQDEVDPESEFITGRE